MLFDKSIHINCKSYFHLVSHYHLEHDCSCYFIKLFILIANHISIWLAINYHLEHDCSCYFIKVFILIATSIVRSVLFYKSTDSNIAIYQLQLHLVSHYYLLNMVVYESIHINCNSICNLIKVFKYSYISIATLFN